LRENYFLAATTRGNDTMEQLAIRQTYDVVAHVRFEIVQLENDWIDWCTECTIDLKMSMKNELQVKKEQRCFTYGNICFCGGNKELTSSLRFIGC
jgi:hypothetical protein